MASGIELNPTYAAMAEARVTRDLPLFADVAVQSVHSGDAGGEGQTHLSLEAQSNQMVNAAPRVVEQDFAVPLMRTTKPLSA